VPTAMLADVGLADVAMLADVGLADVVTTHHAG
jgi:hypothetical protein